METRTYDFSGTESPLAAGLRGYEQGSQYLRDLMQQNQDNAIKRQAAATANQSATDENARANEEAGMSYEEQVGHALDAHRAGDTATPVDPGMSAGPPPMKAPAPFVGATSAPQGIPGDMRSAQPSPAIDRSDVPQVNPKGTPLASAPTAIPPAAVGAALQSDGVVHTHPTTDAGPPVSAAADTGIHKTFGQKLQGIASNLDNGGYQAQAPQKLVKTGPSQREQQETDRETAKSRDVAATNEARIRVAEIAANARIRTAHIYMQQSGVNQDPTAKGLADVAKAAEARMVEAGKQKKALEGSVLAKPSDVIKAQNDYEAAVQDAKAAADELNGYVQTHNFNTAPPAGGPQSRRVVAPPPPTGPTKTTYKRPPGMDDATWQKYLKDTNQVE